MSGFASFRKCDLQIHSCRDPYWQGPRPVGLGDLLPSGKKAVEADVEAARQAWEAWLLVLNDRLELSLVHEKRLVPRA